MNLQDKTHMFRLADDDLLQVSGGNSIIQNERGEEVKEGRFITSTWANYSSGEFPKYAVGDLVKIKWRVSSGLEVLCNTEVLGISENKNGGLLFRKFTYSVKILTCPNSDLLGMIETGVHENCLFR